MNANKVRSFAIVPAAGRSMRMGHAKLLLEWHGRPLIQHLLNAWLRSGVDRIIVVVRADDGPLIEQLAPTDVDLVVPATPPPHMKDSVTAALIHLRDHYQPQPDDLWLLAPADLPQLSVSIVRQVLAAAHLAPGSIIVPRSGARRGHPVAFPWRLHEAVFELRPDQGVNALLGQFPSEHLEIAEVAEESDIDRPEDYERLRARRAAGNSCPAEAPSADPGDQKSRDSGPTDR